MQPEEGGLSHCRRLCSLPVERFRLSAFSISGGKIMAAVSVFPSFFMLMLLFGGQTGVPLGLPPLPEDRTMASVAPQECIWYFSWSGAADADPKSANQTEQLLAEPEIREFVHSVGKAIAAAMKRGSADAARKIARRGRAKVDPHIADASRRRVHLETRSWPARGRSRRRHRRRHRG